MTCIGFELRAICRESRESADFKAMAFRFCLGKIEIMQGGMSHHLPVTAVHQRMPKTVLEPQTWQGAVLSSLRGNVLLRRDSRTGGWEQVERLYPCPVADYPFTSAKL
jgi:hypothetical protein